ncbi:hypothetical protein B0H17DRAFT_571391 [Mycena rosella]|uniref:XRRM domain-containing protein n=1 Tax=Mycena rosella TaxID=1033263 RepID=A0AAD7GWR0_MYCRO|nr:hypothetical protein B0H17DRAFT_571391 [Mycena rosella]
MSAPFAFVPRKVARTSKPPPGNAPLPPNAHPSSSTTNTSASAKGKGREMPPERPQALEAPAKSQYSDEDYTVLLCLSLSKHRLWSDPDLRRDIEWSSRARSNDGFFPLSYLLESACPLSAAHASETVIVKALRTYAIDVVDVRMAIPSSGDGPGRTRGNFEIRPKFWDDGVYPVSREGWENRTVYVENIPIKYKTVPGFCRFILGLLPATSTMPAHNRVQGITLPSHHSGDPGTEPKPRSFALITLADVEDAESLLTAWPWARQQQPEQASSDASEAVKFGFRALSKARWDELNAQYLSYRAKLLADIQEEEAEVPVAPALPTAAPFQNRREPTRKAPPVDEPIAFVSTMSYPRNCLVFVRNIHPETNKTTLRTFFARAVDAKDAIDYVDFNKGMDSCYLRLTSASHAKSFADHFAQNQIVHANGLDDSGCPSTGGAAKAVEAELVLGKREEVYWEKVPEKVRLLAVQKALGHEGAPPVENDAEGGEGRRRQRKRQKR